METVPDAGGTHDAANVGWLADNTSSLTVEGANSAIAIRKGSATILIRRSHRRRLGSIRRESAFETVRIGIEPRRSLAAYPAPHRTSAEQIFWTLVRDCRPGSGRQRA